MSLKQKIDAYKAGFAAKVPEETRVIMQQATKELQNSPQMQSTIQTGDKAPLFSLHNYLGEVVKLNELTRLGPVVISFYRGTW